MLDARLSMVQLLGDVDMIRKIEPSQGKASDNVRPYEEKYEWKGNAHQVLENEE
jgi:hypothetical protein